jgi:Ca2+-binding RTX toxin-like protein
LVGNGGDDLLTGGAGNDLFDYNAISDSGVGAGNRDVITDFEGAGATVADRIDLSTIDADPGGNDNPFSFLGTGAFTGVDGQLRVTSDGAGGALVQGDVNGDMSADFEIQVAGILPTAFDATDFVL